MQDGMNLVLILSAAFVAPLGSDDFRTRERGSKRLGVVADKIPWLINASHPFAEIDVRQRMALRKQRENYLNQVADRIYPRHYPKLPWIDRLPFDVEIPGYGQGNWREFFEMAQGEQTGPEWDRYRKGTAHLVRHLARSGWRENDIRDLLDRMVESEKDWRKQYEKPPAP